MKSIKLRFKVFSFKSSFVFLLLALSGHIHSNLKDLEGKLVTQYQKNQSSEIRQMLALLRHDIAVQYFEKWKKTKSLKDYELAYRYITVSRTMFPNSETINKTYIGINKSNSFLPGSHLDTELSLLELNKKSPKNLDYRSLLVDHYMSKRNYKSAYKHYSRLLTDFPGWATQNDIRRFVLIHAKSQRENLGINYLFEQLQIYPKHNHINLGLAILYKSRGQANLAKKYLRKITKSDDEKLVKQAEELKKTWRNN